MTILAHKIKMMSKIHQQACEPPQPLHLLDLPFRLEYVLLHSFGLSPFQTLFHSVWFESLNLPPLPADLSDFNVHCALENDKVKTKLCYVLCHGGREYIKRIMTLIAIMSVILGYYAWFVYVVVYVSSMPLCHWCRLAQRSAGFLWILLTCIRYQLGVLKVSLKIENCILFLFLLLYVL